jgi:hypothetical protein
VKIIRDVKVLFKALEQKDRELVIAVAVVIYNNKITLDEKEVIGKILSETILDNIFLRTNDSLQAKSFVAQNIKNHAFATNKYVVGRKLESFRH